MQAEKWWSEMAEVGCNGASERCGERWPCVYAGHISTMCGQWVPSIGVHDPMKLKWMSYRSLGQTGMKCVGTYRASGASLWDTGHDRGTNCRRHGPERHHKHRKPPHCGPQHPSATRSAKHTIDAQVTSQVTLFRVMWHRTEQPVGTCSYRLTPCAAVAKSRHILAQ
jgi:hypothetical protein